MTEITRYVSITRVGKADHLPHFLPLDLGNRNWSWLKGTLKENGFPFQINLFEETKRCEALCILRNSLNLYYEHPRPYSFLKHQEDTTMSFYNKAYIVTVGIHMHVFTESLGTCLISWILSDSAKIWVGFWSRTWHPTILPLLGLFFTMTL